MFIWSQQPLDIRVCAEKDPSVFVYRLSPLYAVFWITQVNTLQETTDGFSARLVSAPGIQRAVLLKVPSLSCCLSSLQSSRLSHNTNAKHGCLSVRGHLFAFVVASRGRLSTSGFRQHQDTSTIHCSALPSSAIPVVNTAERWWRAPPRGASFPRRKSRRWTGTSNGGSRCDGSFRGGSSRRDMVIPST